MTEDQHQPTSTKAKRHDKGFTLIELLIVTAILGTLSAVVVVSVGGITDKVQTIACKAESQTLEVASDSYQAANSLCPTSAAELDAAGYLQSAPKLSDVTGDGTEQLIEPTG